MQLDVNKGIIYVVEQPVLAVSVVKAIIYVVEAPPLTINVQKGIVYAVEQIDLRDRLFAKDDGEWESVLPWVKLEGEWVNPYSVWIKEAGIWKLSYYDFTIA